MLQISSLQYIICQFHSLSVQIGCDSVSARTNSKLYLITAVLYQVDPVDWGLGPVVSAWAPTDTAMDFKNNHTGAPAHVSITVIKPEELSAKERQLLDALQK